MDSSLHSYDIWRYCPYDDWMCIIYWYETWNIYNYIIIFYVYSLSYHTDPGWKKAELIEHQPMKVANWFCSNPYQLVAYPLYSQCIVPAAERSNLVQWNSLDLVLPMLKHVETLPLTCCFSAILCQGMPLRSVEEIVKSPEWPSSIMAPKTYGEAAWVDAVCAGLMCLWTLIFSGGQHGFLYTVVK